MSPIQHDPNNSIEKSNSDNEKKKSIPSKLNFQITGLIIAVLAILVPVSMVIWADSNNHKRHQERMEFDQKRRESKVTIQIGRDYEQKTILFEKYSRKHDNTYAALFKQRYHLTLNNLGLQPASITDWEILARVPTDKKAAQWYDGMGPWFFSLDHTPISPPFTIKPNEPINIYVEIGTRVPQVAWNAVKGKITHNQEYGYHDAEIFFAKVGFSNFGQGQLSEVSKNSDNITAFFYTQSPYYQEYFLKLTKGNGSRIRAEFSPQASYSRIQGEK